MHVRRATRHIEQRIRRDGYERLCGIDEVGRGAWAGPLVVGAVILDRDATTPVRFSGLRDSKALTPAARERLFTQITRRACAWGVGIVEHTIIDREGLRAAQEEATILALRGVSLRPDFFLFDGNAPPLYTPGKSFVRGDARIASIAAASIIAKVIRDRIMRAFHLEYPTYGFFEHKGYGTPHHQRAIARYGLCSIHRRSFVPPSLFVGDILQEK